MISDDSCSRRCLCRRLRRSASASSSFSADLRRAVDERAACLSLFGTRIRSWACRSKKSCSIACVAATLAILDSAVCRSSDETERTWIGLGSSSKTDVLRR
jgi:hypothetical protein